MIVWKVVTVKKFKRMSDYLDFIVHTKKEKDVPEDVLKKIMTEGKAEIYSIDSLDKNVESYTLWAVEER